MKRILMGLGVALLAGAASADDSYLWWMVDREADSKFNYTYAALKATKGDKATGGSEIGDTVIGKGVPGVASTSLIGYGAGWSYYIELLNEKADGSTEAVAVSSLATWESLAKFISTQPTTPWMGGSYHAVPEPTSGLLLLLGVAGLALRRKRA